MGKLKKMALGLAAMGLLASSPSYAKPPPKFNNKPPSVELKPPGPRDTMTPTKSSRRGIEEKSSRLVKRSIELTREELISVFNDLMKKGFELSKRLEREGLKQFSPEWYQKVTEFRNTLPFEYSKYAWFFVANSTEVFEPPQWFMNEIDKLFRAPPNN